MKLFILTLLFSLNSLAQVAFFPVGKNGANINYAEKGKCEEIEQMPCYNVAICPTAYCDVVTETSYDEETGITIEEKVLKVNESKKAQFDQAEKAKEDELKAKEAAKKKACDDLELEDIDKATTIAALRRVVKLFKECER